MLNWLERRIARFAIPNLTLLLIISQLLTYAACQADPRMREKFLLIPAKVLDGEIYRLFSFLAMPPFDSAIWAFFFWYLFYLMGRALETYWGTPRFNLFLLIGYVATVSGSFLVPDQAVGNGFLQGTVFLAFAYLNPTFTLYILFVFPVQIRWLAYLTWILYLIRFSFGTYGDRIAVAASVMNYMFFFGRDILQRARYRQRHMQRQVTRFREKKPEYVHKCEVCGITDNDDRNMDFRYCGKCAGDLCYCSEHLRDHEHVAESEAGDD